MCKCCVSSPELLLRGRGVERVLQLGLQRLQLLSQVSAVFLGFGAGDSLQLQVFLKFTQLSLQLTDLLLGQILLSRFLLDPDGKSLSVTCSDLTFRWINAVVCDWLS